MTIIYVILVIIALILLLALFMSKDMNYEKSISINASIDKVWDNVGSLTSMDKWSPWKDKDPNMKSNLTGDDGTVGAKQSWESEVKGVGAGSQTITNIEKPALIETKLNFIKPFKSEADGYVKLLDQKESTQAIWGFKSQMPYPMNLMKLFMNFEKSMDKDFGDGLNRLKNICENKL
jgi:Polyketide cyclase / dehydrase and lipid transport